MIETVEIQNASAIKAECCRRQIWGWTCAMWQLFPEQSQSACHKKSLRPRLFSCIQWLVHLVVHALFFTIPHRSRYIWSLRSAALSLHAIHQGLYNSRQFKKIIIVDSSPSQHPACLMKDGFMRCSHTRVPQENCPSGDRKRTCPKISWGGNTLTTEILPEISKQ